MQRPVYSNVAFTLLNYALGQATGLTYPQLLYEYLTGPLGMVNTYPSPGVFTTAAVPPVGNSWGFYFGDATPGGGLVSTLSDLSRFIYGILTYTIFNSPAAVREWLQPRSFTGSQHSFFGMPWEIYRPPPEAVFPNYNPATGDGGHTVTIYTKDGAAYGYRARVSIIDEYGIGFVLLAAGDATAVTAINDAMLHLLLPAVDKASREQVEELGYVGVFASACPIANLTVYAGNSTRWANSTTGSTSPAVNTTSTFSADIVLDGKSLVLAKLTRGNKDILAALRDIFLATYGMLVPNYRPGDILRLYPAEVSTKGTFQGRDVVREDWRMVWDVTRQVLHSDLPGQGISSYDCLAWEAVDWIYYGHEAVDRFVFIKDADTGQVIGFEAPFLREVATRDGLSCAKDAGILKRVRRNR